MGRLLRMMMTPGIATAIPAPYGAEGFAVGWVPHRFHSVVFGVVLGAPFPLLWPR